MILLFSGRDNPRDTVPDPKIVINSQAWSQCSDFLPQGNEWEWCMLRQENSKEMALVLLQPSKANSVPLKEEHTPMQLMVLSSWAFVER